MTDITLEGSLLKFHKTVWHDDDIFLAKCLWFTHNIEKSLIICDLTVTLKTAVAAFMNQAYPAFMCQDIYKEDRDRVNKDIGKVYKALRKQYESEVAPRIPYWNKLFKHQKNVLTSIYHRRVNLLGMQMRTGKSISASSHSKAIGAKRTVILCFTIGKWNWVKDLTGSRWNAKDNEAFDQFDFTVLDAVQRKCSYAFNERFVICNYESAANYMKYLITNGQRVTDHIIIDECQRVKSVNSGLHKAVAELISSCPNARITLMSGTYLMNRVDDAFSYLRLTGNPLGEKKSDFDRRFLVKSGSRNKGAQDTGFLAACMSNFAIRVLFADCVDVPKKQHFQLHFPIGEWREKYDEAVHKAIHDQGKRVSNSWIHSVNNVMAQSKVPGTMEHALQAIEEGNKVVIFTSYNEPLNMLSALLGEAKVNYVRIDGNVLDAKDKMDLATKFQEDPECMCCIANIAAAGHTVPLHASSIMYVLNQTLTPKAIEQAVARLENLEKKEPITIYYPTAIGEGDEITVDMKLTELNAGKLFDIDAVVDGGKDINNLGNISEMVFESMRQQYGSRDAREEIEMEFTETDNNEND